MKFKNLGLMLTSQTKILSKKPLIYFNDKKYSYTEVDNTTNSFARYLERLGIKKGDKVAILMQNSPEYIISIFSILKAGAVVIPINHMLIDSEIAYIVNDSEAKVLITSEKFADMIGHFKENCKGLTSINTWGDNTFKAKNIFKELVSYSDSEYICQAEFDDLAFFIYTSGTTGFPKGAMISHGNLITNMDSIDKCIAIKPDEKFLVFLPLFHSYTLTTSVLYPVSVSTSIVLLESVAELRTKRFRNILIFKRPRIMLGVPQIFQALVKAKFPKWFIKFVYPIKLHISGGAPISEETLNAFKAKYGVPVLEGYGLSEASPLVSFNTFKNNKVSTVGKLLPGLQGKIIDENEKEVPLGEVGELIIKGGNVMKGYWKMPKATDDAIKNGWLFTGDFAKIDSEDYVTIVDRKKDLIISKGMNIYPREIEDLMLENPQIEAAAVIGIPNANKDEVVVAYAQLVEGATITEKEIKDYIRTRVASFKNPRYVNVLDALPLTATGKVLKRELKRMVIAGEIKFDK